MASDQRHKPRQTLKCFTEPGPCRKIHRSKSGLRYSCVWHQDGQALDTLLGFPRGRASQQPSRRGSMESWRDFSCKEATEPTVSYSPNTMATRAKSHRAERGGHPAPAAHSSAGDTTAPANTDCSWSLHPASPTWTKETTPWDVINMTQEIRGRQIAPPPAARTREATGEPPQHRHGITTPAKPEAGAR